MKLVLNTYKIIEISNSIDLKLWRFLTEESSYNELKFIMMAISLPGLMVSGTLWGSIYFWVWLFLTNDVKSYHNLEECS